MNKKIIIISPQFWGTWGICQHTGWSIRNVPCSVITQQSIWLDVSEFYSLNVVTFALRDCINVMGDVIIR